MNTVRQDQAGCQGLNILLQISLKRSRAVYRVVTVVHDKLLCGVGEFNDKLLIRKTSVDIGNKQIDDISDVVLRERLEEDRLIKTVQELRTEVCAQVVHNLGLCLRLDITVLVDAVKQVLGTDVGCQDDDRVLEVHGLAHGIRDTSVIENLKQDIEYIRVRFLDLIEEDNAVRFSADCLSQLTALIVSDISWRRSDQTGYGVLLHVFTHIDTNHVVLIVEQVRRKCLRKLGLADTGRSEEQERTDRLCRVLDSGFGTDDRVRNLLDRLILADNTFVELVIQMECLVSLTLGEFCNRDSGPAGDDSRDLIVCDTLMDKAQIRILYLLLLFLQLFLKLRKFAVLEFCCLVQVILLLCVLDLAVN